MAAGQSANVAAQTVGRLPQTTQGIPGGGPFIRYAEESVALAYSTAGIAFGGLSNLPLTAVPGFLRALVVTVQATGGSGATASVTGTADAPWNTISQLTLRDASGQPIYPAIDGFGMFLINLYSGQVGQGGDQDPRGLSSFSAIQSTSGSGAGNFTFKIWVPLEYNSSGYCALPADNSAELPKLLIQFAASGTVYTTAPATLPTITLTVEEMYWAVPNNMPDLAPYDVGASAQWLITTSGQNPPSNAYMRVLDQGVGQFVHTKIFVYRDSTGARGNGTVEHWPASPENWIDQFQYRLELLNTRNDLLGLFFGRGLGIPAAATSSQTQQFKPLDTIVYTWRDSVQRQISTADDAENVLVTTGSTKFEIAGTWATLGSNSPPSLTCYTGMIFPGESGYPFGSQSH
jgi:hypothetical protein